MPATSLIHPWNRLNGSCIQNKNKDAFYFSYLIPRQFKFLDEMINSCCNKEKSNFIGIERKCKCLVWASVPKEDFLSCYCLIEILIDPDHNENYAGCRFMMEHYFRIISIINQCSLNRVAFTSASYVNKTCREQKPFFSTLSRLYNVKNVCEILKKNKNIQKVHLKCDVPVFQFPKPDKLHDSNKGDNFLNAIVTMKQKLDFEKLKNNAISLIESAQLSSQDKLKDMLTYYRNDGFVLRISNEFELFKYPITATGEVLIHCGEKVDEKEYENLKVLVPGIEDLKNIQVSITEDNDLFQVYTTNRTKMMPDTTVYHKFISELIRKNLNTTSDDDFVILIDEDKILFKIPLLNSTSQLDIDRMVKTSSYELGVLGFKNSGELEKLKNHKIHLLPNGIWEIYDKHDNVKLDYSTICIEQKLSRSLNTLSNGESVIKLSESGHAFLIPINKSNDMLLDCSMELSQQELKFLIDFTINEEISNATINRFNMDSAEFVDKIKLLKLNGFELGITNYGKMVKIPLDENKTLLIKDMYELVLDEVILYNCLIRSSELRGYKVILDENDVLIKSRVVDRHKRETHDFLDTKLKDTIKKLNDSGYNLLITNEGEVNQVPSGSVEGGVSLKYQYNDVYRMLNGIESLCGYEISLSKTGEIIVANVFNEDDGNNDDELIKELPSEMFAIFSENYFGFKTSKLYQVQLGQLNEDELEAEEVFDPENCSDIHVAKIYSKKFSSILNLPNVQDLKLEINEKSEGFRLSLVDHTASDMIKSILDKNYGLKIHSDGRIEKFPISNEAGQHIMDESVLLTEEDFTTPMFDSNLLIKEYKGCQFVIDKDGKLTKTLFEKASTSSRDRYSGAEYSRLRFDNDFKTLIKYYQSKQKLLFVTIDTSVLQLPIDKDGRIAMVDSVQIPYDEYDKLKRFGCLKDYKGYALGLDKDDNIIKINLDETRLNEDDPLMFMIRNRVPSHVSSLYTVEEGREESFQTSLNKIGELSLELESCIKFNYERSTNIENDSYHIIDIPTDTVKQNDFIYKRNEETNESQNNTSTKSTSETALFRKQSSNKTASAEEEDDCLTFQVSQSSKMDISSDQHNQCITSTESQPLNYAVDAKDANKTETEIPYSEKNEEYINFENISKSNTDEAAPPNQQNSSKQPFASPATNYGGIKSDKLNTLSQKENTDKVKPATNDDEIDRMMMIVERSKMPIQLSSSMNSHPGMASDKLIAINELSSVKDHASISSNVDQKNINQQIQVVQPLEMQPNVIVPVRSDDVVDKDELDLNDEIVAIPSDIFGQLSKDYLDILAKLEPKIQNLIMEYAETHSQYGSDFIELLILHGEDFTKKSLTITDVEMEYKLIVAAVTNESAESPHDISRDSSTLVIGNVHIDLPVKVQLKQEPKDKDLVSLVSTYMNQFEDSNDEDSNDETETTTSITEDTTTPKYMPEEYVQPRRTIPPTSTTATENMDESPSVFANTPKPSKSKNKSKSSSMTKSNKIDNDKVVKVPHKKYVRNNTFCPSSTGDSCRFNHSVIKYMRRPKNNMTTYKYLDDIYRKREMNQPRMGDVYVQEMMKSARPINLIEDGREAWFIYDTRPKLNCNSKRKSRLRMNFNTSNFFNSKIDLQPKICPRRKIQASYSNKHSFTHLTLDFNETENDKILRLDFFHTFEQTTSLEEADNESTRVELNSLKLIDNEKSSPNQIIEDDVSFISVQLNEIEKRQNSEFGDKKSETMEIPIVNGGVQENDLTPHDPNSEIVLPISTDEALEKPDVIMKNQDSRVWSEGTSIATSKIFDGSSKVKPGNVIEVMVGIDEQEGDENETTSNIQKLDNCIKSKELRQNSNEEDSKEDEVVIEQYTDPLEREHNFPIHKKESYGVDQKLIEGLEPEMYTADNIIVRKRSSEDNYYSIPKRHSGETRPLISEEPMQDIYSSYDIVDNNGALIMVDKEKSTVPIYKKVSFGVPSNFVDESQLALRAADSIAIRNPNADEVYLEPSTDQNDPVSVYLQTNTENLYSPNNLTQFISKTKEALLQTCTSTNSIDESMQMKITKPLEATEYDYKSTLFGMEGIVAIDLSSDNNNYNGKYHKKPLPPLKRLRSRQHAIYNNEEENIK